MGVYNLKFNRLKYTFGVQTDNFLRFLVHPFTVLLRRNDTSFYKIKDKEHQLLLKK
jgi:hypothetical protein